jgi:pilus assembly protein CpaC
MRNVLMLVAFLVAVHVSLAQGTSSKTPSVPRDPPIGSVGTRSAKIENLLKAAEHLEAAGLKEDAERFRRQADHERAAAVVEIEALRAEVEQLRALTAIAQPLLLHVRVFQFSRTKLRALGPVAREEAFPARRSVVDALRENTDDAVISALGTFGSGTACVALAPDDRFFTTLESLAKKGLMKLVADPTIGALSGRSASFHSGGEIPVPESRSLGTTSISWKKYGTQLDFVAIAAPRRMIRLDCRARVSEIDRTLRFVIDGTAVPALRDQEVETSAEVRAGQTLVIGGLVQTYMEAENVELPGSGSTGKSDKNHVVQEIRNEVETLFLLTPELAAATR